jgi:hypothetical protein
MPWNTLLSHERYTFSISKTLGLLHCNLCNNCTPIHSGYNHVKKHLGKVQTEKLKIFDSMVLEFVGTPWEGLVPNLEQTKLALVSFFSANGKLPKVKIESNYYLCFKEDCVQCFNCPKNLIKHLK